VVSRATASGRRGVSEVIIRIKALGVPGGLRGRLEAEEVWEKAPDSEVRAKPHWDEAEEARARWRKPELRGSGAVERKR